MKNTEDHKSAILYARLASLPSLEKLPEVEKNSLIAFARNAGFRWLDFAHQDKDPFAGRYKNRPLGPEFTRDLMSLIYYRRKKGRPMATYWDALKMAHKKGRPLILRLMKEGHVDLRPLSHLIAPVLQTHTDHSSRQQFTVTEIWPNPTLEEEISHGLVQFLRQPRCALRWCPGPHCGHVFVPNHGQRYCSRACLTRGVEVGRQQSRRAYMREYMAKRRADAKKPKTNKRTAKAA